MKQMIVLEGLDQILTEQEISANVEDLDLNGSGWIYNRTTSVVFDLYKELTKRGSSYVEAQIN